MAWRSSEPCTNVGMSYYIYIYISGMYNLHQSYEERDLNTSAPLTKLASVPRVSSLGMTSLIMVALKSAILMFTEPRLDRSVAVHGVFVGRVNFGAMQSGVSGLKQLVDYWRSSRLEMHVYTKIFCNNCQCVIT